MLERKPWDFGISEELVRKIESGEIGVKPDIGCEEMGYARSVFDEMYDKGLVVWSYVIGGYVKVGLFDEGLGVFGEMLKAGVVPDEVVMASVVKGVAGLGALDVGIWVLGYIVKRRILVDVKLRTTLVNMYAQCGCIEKAKEVFDGMVVKDSRAWSSTIVGFAIHGLADEASSIFADMEEAKGNDQMIRDGKRSVSRELIRFMELIDEISMENELISIRKVKIGKTGNKSVILQRESRIRGSGSRVHDDDLRNLAENLKSRIVKLNGVEKRREVGGLMKSQRVVKSQPKVKKNVSFDEDGNVYRLIERKRGVVLSDGSESSNGDDEVVEEIGVSNENGVEEEEEDSSEMSENEMDPRENLGTRTYQASKTNQPGGVFPVNITIMRD
ncbi:DYW domain-containing protein [Artemisia annua]|uniref:DYW domain-containing protein n=1 Tax=Artemisia annua TaxID=35608 RepID=A0A2U1QAA7_ARTAN|nr:DYW domain-containing protein [Artemisia annua]